MTGSAAGALDHDTKAVLLKAAVECFAQHGFSETSIRMIADRAQRHQSLIHHYFGNKEDVYLEVFKVITQTAPWPSESVDPVPEGGRVPRDYREAVRFLREQIHSFYCHTSVMGDADDAWRMNTAILFLREMHSPRPILHSLFLGYVGPQVETIKNCIHFIRPELNDTEIAFFGISLMGLVAGHHLMQGFNQLVWKQSTFIENPFQASERLVEFCFHGLLANPLPPPPGRPVPCEPHDARPGSEGAPANPANTLPKYI